MAEESEKSGAESAAKPEKPDATSNKSELPSVDSPSISPAEPETPAEIIPSTAIVPFTAPTAGSMPPREAPTAKSFRLRARHKLMAGLAASVVVAGAIGVMVGVAASGGFRQPQAPKVDTAALEERQAMQQSIARLNKEIGALKTNLDAANKAAHTQIAKLSDRLNREAAEITGSIAAPQSAPAAAPTPPAPVVTPVQTTTPLPTPRPVRMAAVEPPRRTVVPDWSIRDTRNGYVYVQNRGEVYEVMPGVPLPGLGTVEQIRREDGRWVVVTPRGLIISVRDRAYYE